MKPAAMLVLVLLVPALSPVVKADGISNLPVPLGIVNAIVGFTPIEDSESGFGRIFLNYTLNGDYNAFVFWSSSDEAKPFTVSNSQITFLPGTYDHYLSGGKLLETLTIAACELCNADVFSFNRGAYIFTLPSTVTPAINTNIGAPQTSNDNPTGDEYYVHDVPMLVSDVAPLPEPGTFPLLGIGLIVLVTYASRRR